MFDDPYNLRELEAITPAETVVLYRRRMGLSQSKLAYRFQMSMWKLTAWENGTREAPDMSRFVLPLYHHEVCFLYRRRAKKTISEVARDMGCVPYWIKRLERGHEPRYITNLLEYWEC